MQFSLNWLQDFFSAPLSSTVLEETLTKAGLEVDAIIQKKPRFEGVIVARVESVSSHPNADKLCIATVFDGAETLQVVCGATNCKKGLVTAFAPIGSLLFDASGKKHKIKQGSLRGVDSFGMLLSSEELGFDEKSDGIIEFSEEYTVGAKLASLFQDEVLEISFTPNLGHAMSHLGIARETSALLGIPYKLTPTPSKKPGTFKTSENLSVETESDCFSYGCMLIKNVQVGPSPLWLRLRLESCGIKSINNVVDVTNYILHEMGQPMHAFDFDLIEDAKIDVKMSKKPETLLTLDNTERTVPKGSLLIYDGKKPVAIAGIMGAANSEVSTKTQNILLEAAHFNPKVIRKTSKTLGLYTEASKHFERGVDGTIFEEALNRASSLIQKVAGGEVAVDVVKVVKQPHKSKTITCRLSRINRLLGTKLTKEDVMGFFERLELSVKESEEVFQVTVPPYRNDLHLEIDLVEEAARVYGLDKLQSATPKCISNQLADSPLYLMEQKMHHLFLQEGLQEIITCDLISPDMDQLNREKGIAVLNYMSQEQSILRTSLLANHLTVLKNNQDHQRQNVQIYELGKVYKMNGECYEENFQARITLTGRHSPYHWSKKEDNLDFFHLKGIIENILNRLLPGDIVFKKSHNDRFHPGIQAEIIYDEQVIGILGEVHPAILRKMGLKQPVFTAQLVVAPLVPLAERSVAFTPISPFPSSERDWTLTSLDDLEIGHLIRLIKSIPSRILKNVFLLDIYKSEKIGAQRKNVTLRFVYRNDKKTLSFETIEMEHARIISDVQAKMNTLIIEPT